MPIILLFGMPRSGTTWIGKIFDSHTQTLYRHEPDTWTKITEIPYLEIAENYEQYCTFLNNYIDSFIFSRRPEINGKLPLFNKSYSSFMRQFIFRYGIYFSSIVAKLINNVRLPVPRNFAKSKVREVTVVWKSIQLLGRFGIIARCLDNCKGIHILRHPCGYIASVLDGESKRKFTSYIPASDDYPVYEKLLSTSQAKRYNLSLDKLKDMSPEERLAWRWVLFNEKALDDTENNPNIKVVRYEDICDNPVEVAKNLFSFCGLDWCEQTNEFLTASTGKNSDSYYSVYKDPKKSANKWRNKLSNDKIREIEKVVSQSRIGKYYSGQI